MDLYLELGDTLKNTYIDEKCLFWDRECFSSIYVFTKVSPSSRYGSILGILGLWEPPKNGPLGLLWKIKDLGITSSRGEIIKKITSYTLKVFLMGNSKIQLPAPNSPGPQSYGHVLVLTTFKSLVS